MERTNEIGLDMISLLRTTGFTQQLFGWHDAVKKWSGVIRRNEVGEGWHSAVMTVIEGRQITWAGRLRNHSQMMYKDTFNHVVILSFLCKMTYVK